MIWRRGVPASLPGGRPALSRGSRPLPVRRLALQAQMQGHFSRTNPSSRRCHSRAGRVQVQHSLKFHLYCFGFRLDWSKIPGIAESAPRSSVLREASLLSRSVRSLELGRNVISGTKIDLVVFQNSVDAISLVFQGVAEPCQGVPTADLGTPPASTAAPLRRTRCSVQSRPHAISIRRLAVSPPDLCRLG